MVAAQGVPFSWADGSETSLVLSPTPSSETGCAQQSDGIVHFWFDATTSLSTADGSLGGAAPGEVHIVGWPDRVVAIFEMNHSATRDQLTALLPRSSDASRYDGGFVDFDITHHFAWPGEEWLGADGALTIMVTDPACDSDECDGMPLTEGRVPPEAAAPELE
jgi:hypothetical protein